MHFTMIWSWQALNWLWAHSWTLGAGVCFGSGNGSGNIFLTNWSVKVTTVKHLFVLVLFAALYCAVGNEKEDKIWEFDGSHWSLRIQLWLGTLWCQQLQQIWFLTVVDVVKVTSEEGIFFFFLNAWPGFMVVSKFRVCILHSVHSKGGYVLRLQRRTVHLPEVKGHSNPNYPRMLCVLLGFYLLDRTFKCKCSNVTCCSHNIYTEK